MELVQKSEQAETNMNHEILIHSLRDPYIGLWKKIQKWLDRYDPPKNRIQATRVSGIGAANQNDIKDVFVAAIADWWSWSASHPNE